MIEDRLEAAAQHRRSGNRESAAFLLESVLDIAPGHAGALYALAEIRLEQGDAQRATELARQAVARDRTSADARVVLARILLATDQHDEAAKIIEDALALNPEHVGASQIQAGILVQAGEIEAAEDLLKTALTRHPGDPRLLAGLGGLFGAVRHDRAALELAQAALAREPDNPDYLAQLGRVLADMGDHEKALDCLTKAHLAAPANPIVTLYLAASQAALGRFTEARALARRLTVMAPDLLAGWLLLVQIDTQRGEAGESFQAFLQRARQHKDRTAALIMLATAYRATGQPDRALPLLQPFLEGGESIDPQQRLQALIIARDCLLASGDLEGLRQALPPGEDGSVLAEPDDPDAHVRALSDGDVLIEPGLSNLETFVLMRFLRGTAAGTAPRTLYGPEHVRQAVALVGDDPFVGYDLPGAPDVTSDGRKPVALTTAFALPAERLRHHQRAVPYVVASKPYRRRWREALGELPGPRIALAWNASRPGMLLDDLQPLLDAVEGSFVSVMWDETRLQMKTSPRIIDAGMHIGSLTDLAGLLAEVDLIVGPDGIPLHVAGAMGRPAALLCQPAPAWYWHAENGRASWYPSVQVVQTPRFGNWTELMTDVLPVLLDHLHTALGHPDAPDDKKG